MGSRILRQSTAKTKKKKKEEENARNIENEKWWWPSRRLLCVNNFYWHIHSLIHIFILFYLLPGLYQSSLSFSLSLVCDDPFYCLQFEWLMTSIYFRCVVVVHRHTAYRLGSPFVFRCQCHWKQPNPAERIPVCLTFCRFVFLLRRNQRINYAC